MLQARSMGRRQADPTGVMLSQHIRSRHPRTCVPAQAVLARCQPSKSVTPRPRRPQQQHRGPRKNHAAPECEDEWIGPCSATVSTQRNLNSTCCLCHSNSSTAARRLPNHTAQPGQHMLLSSQHCCQKASEHAPSWQASFRQCRWPVDCLHGLNKHITSLPAHPTNGVSGMVCNT